MEGWYVLLGVGICAVWGRVRIPKIFYFEQENPPPRRKRRGKKQVQ